MFVISNLSYLTVHRNPLHCVLNPPKGNDAINIHVLRINLQEGRGGVERGILGRLSWVAERGGVVLKWWDSYVHKKAGTRVLQISGDIFGCVWWMVEIVMCSFTIVYVVNTHSITSSRTFLSRYNLSAIKLNQDWIPGSKCHTGT